MPEQLPEAGVEAPGEEEDCLIGGVGTGPEGVEGVAGGTATDDELFEGAGGMATRLTAGVEAGVTTVPTAVG